MTLFLIAWRNLWAKPLQSLLTIAVVATALTMTIVVMLLASSLQNGLARATEPFDLIVGAKGSPNQLVLNTVFLQDIPIGNIDYDLVRELRANPLVASAIPLGFGDNYRGYRLAGTEAGLFAHRIKAGAPPWIELAAGRAFSAPYEAVLGAKTARETGLKVGDQFASAHGVTAGGDTHGDRKFTVVGIMRPVGGPYDQVILVSLDSLWGIHDHHGHKEAPGAEHGHGDRRGHEEEKAAGHDHGPDLGTTVILVKPQGYGEALRLYQQFQKEPRAQMVFPAQVVVRLFAMLGDGEKVLTVIGYTVFAMAFLLVAFSLYWSALSRARERAVLRALGAERKDIFVIILAEGLLLLTAGVSAGLLAGHALFAVVADTLQKKTAIALAGPFSTAEVAAVVAILFAGAAASLIPALHTAREDIGASL